MELPALSVDDFRRIVTASQPTGKAWSGNVRGTNTYSLNTALGSGLKLMYDYMQIFPANGNPLTCSEEALPLWEDFLGIPDVCFPATGTFNERRRDAYVKFFLMHTDQYVEIATLYGLDIIFNNLTTFEHSVEIINGQNYLNNFVHVFPFSFKSLDSIVSQLNCIFGRMLPATDTLVFSLGDGRITYGIDTYGGDERYGKFI